MAANAERLLRDFDRAGARLREARGTTQGGVAAEVLYGQAYQALVRAGLAPQIRPKYRRKVSGR